MPDLGERVAALEAILAVQLGLPSPPDWTETAVAEFRERLAGAGTNPPSLPVFPVPDRTAALEGRVAALEARLAPGPLLKPFGLPPLTGEQEAQIKRDFDETMRVPSERHFTPHPPPLAPDEIRYLLSECVTVVKPGETLVIRGRNWTPNQAGEIQRVMDAMREDGRIPFRALAVFGDELAVAEEAPGAA